MEMTREEELEYFKAELAKVVENSSVARYYRLCIANLEGRELTEETTDLPLTE